MRHIETEIKWDANSPRAFFKMLQAAQDLAQISCAEKLYLQDTYLDTPTHTLSKQKIALRVRHFNKQWEATFKTKTKLQNGCAVRQEETLSLPVQTLAQALDFLHHKKMWKQICTQQLCPRFSIKNHRTSYALFYQNTQSELSFDSFEILVCGRSVKMKEIELELKKGSAENLKKLAQYLTQKSGLKLAKISKVKTAEALINLWK